MKILGMGIDLAGNALFEPMDEAEVINDLIAALEPNISHIRSLTQTTSEAVTFRGEIERETLDLGDPRTAGWTYLVNSTDPLLYEIKTILKPLAEHRGMADPLKPLMFNNETPDGWFDWLYDEYYALNLEGDQVPQYVLIVGGPDQIPFRFQSVLDTVSDVGRIEFDQNLDALKAYVDKILRIETAETPLVKKEAIMFAPDGGLPDPTYFSREYMALPLTEYIQDELGFKVHTIIGHQATKKNLEVALAGRNPALVYTASHGLGAFNKTFDIQKRYNGAICCQHTGPFNMEYLFSVDDVPSDETFLEGSVFFQFACYGYGTPAESDYHHWLKGVPKKYTQEDFVAALPKKLLANPKGPIAFIGHLDTAFLHGFTDASEPFTLDRWHTRITPFKSVIDNLLGVQPSGLAMKGMNSRYAVCNALITNTYDREKRGKLKWTDQLKSRFLDNWITRGDAQNYMIFGDPAARLRIPSD